METTLEELSNFFSSYKHLKYKKGELLLRTEDYPKGVFYLTRGFVREFSIAPDGKELTLIIFKPGDFFPIIWALNGTAYSYYMEATTPVEVCCAPREEFVSFIKKNADIFFELTQRILVRMGGLMSRMNYLAFGNAYSKIGSIIAICAERFGDKTNDGITIQVPLTHKMIADFTGITRETASIEIKKLERSNLVHYQGRNLVVKDLSKLKALADW